VSPARNKRTTAGVSLIRFLVGRSHFISGSVDPAELISLTSYSLLLVLVNQESTHMLRTLIAFEGRGRGASVSGQPYGNWRSGQIRNIKLPHDRLCLVNHQASRTAVGDSQVLCQLTRPLHCSSQSIDDVRLISCDALNARRTVVSPIKMASVAK